MKKEGEPNPDIWRVTCTLPQGLQEDAHNIAEWKGQEMAEFVKWSVNLRSQMGEQMEIAKQKGENPAIVVAGTRLHLKNILNLAEYKDQAVRPASFIYSSLFKEHVMKLAEGKSKPPEEYILEAIGLGVACGQIVKEKKIQGAFMQYTVGRESYYIKK